MQSYGQQAPQQGKQAGYGAAPAAQKQGGGSLSSDGTTAPAAPAASLAQQAGALPQQAQQGQQLPYAGMQYASPYGYTANLAPGAAQFYGSYGYAQPAFYQQGYYPQQGSGYPPQTAQFPPGGKYPAQGGYAQGGFAYDEASINVAQGGYSGKGEKEQAGGLYGMQV